MLDVQWLQSRQNPTITALTFLSVRADLGINAWQNALKVVNTRDILHKDISLHY